MERRDKFNYYLDIAETVLERSTCLRRKFGAIIVRNDSIITMYAASLVLDAILYGLQYAKAAFIITAKGDAVNRGIQEHLVRGTTCIPCTGGYSGQARVMILCAIKRGQIAALREAVSTADPDAFVILSEAHEVFGHGFQRPGKHAF